ILLNKINSHMLFILFTRRHVISVSTWSRVYNSLISVSRMAEFRQDAHKHTHTHTHTHTNPHPTHKTPHTPNHTHTRTHTRDNTPSGKYVLYKTICFEQQCAHTCVIRVNRQAVAMVTTIA